MNINKVWWWLPFVVYLIPNIIMGLFTIVFQVLIVDNKIVLFNTNTTSILLNIVLVILFFYIIKIIGDKNSKFLKSGGATHNVVPNNIVGYIVFVLLFLEIVAVILFNYGRVGYTQDSNIYTTIISYIHPEIIFLIYYGHCRALRVPYINLLLFILINVLMGWTGVWATLIFIEFYYMLKKYSKLKLLTHMLAICLLLIFVYPFLSDYRSKMRGEEKASELTFQESMIKLIMRLQYVTSSIMIDQESNDLKQKYKDGTIKPYYTDNKIGERFSLNSIQSISIQKYLTINYLIDPAKFKRNTDIDEVGWYLHTGISGWLFILGFYEFPLFIFFVYVLIASPYWLNKYFIRSESLLPVIHTLNLAYVFHGWFAVQIGLIFGLFWYIIILKVLKKENFILNN